ncbi:winged helix-turn-helix transcriptional regulator [Streptomyces niveus]|uniref:MarR family transcriptional regulator n=1 Tax=Streptomyces niveus TaxID=193462 RepID=A0A1U9R127_STRNV|nr:winged helix-turn-helix transcriptional regulator [Streptomyces niveus]AQU70206.1 MarR family transcriptional regulator [Streptomyces niveus]
MATTALPPTVDADVARVTEALGMITPRWNVRVLLALRAQPLRYTELTDKLPWLRGGQLHPRLRALGDAGLVGRTEHSVHHVTYHLTGRGTTLLPVLPVIATWAEEFLEKPAGPVSTVQNVEDSLILLTRRHAAPILWVLKTREEASARYLADIVMPGGYWTNIYPPLRQLVDDGLVDTAGTGLPYRLTASGHGLGRVFGTLSAWAAGRSLTHASRHPVWGTPETNTRTEPGTWVSRQSRLPAPPLSPVLEAGTSRSPRPVPELFSHAAPARPAEVPVGGARR